MYDDKYYKDLYIKPLFTRLKLSKIYYLWIAYFCIKKATNLKQKNRVLDVGCGIGNLVWALRKIGIKAYGIDPSKTAQKYCRSLKYCQYTNTKKLPYKNSYFDLVYTHEVLEHLTPRDLSLLINELLRVSKGKMIHMICVKDRGKMVSIEPTHKIIQTESWWKKKFESLGFKVEVGNLFYFFPFVTYIFSGKLNFAAIKKGFFLISK